MDVLDRLSDLHRQATQERSHYYTGNVIREAIMAIVELRADLAATEKQRDEAIELAEEMDRFVGDDAVELSVVDALTARLAALKAKRG